MADLNGSQAKHHQHLSCLLVSAIFLGSVERWSAVDNRLSYFETQSEFLKFLWVQRRLVRVSYLHLLLSVSKKTKF